MEIETIETLEEVTIKQLQKAASIAKSHGHAAKMLGISERGYRNLINKYSIETPYLAISSTGRRENIYMRSVTPEERDAFENMDEWGSRGRKKGITEAGQKAL